ncbi:hypothetical protein FM036_37125 [Nostoc sp. HG1]|nr:hypothetical protein [Nostoc sp. HG1]
MLPAVPLPGKQATQSVSNSWHRILILFKIFVLPEAIASATVSSTITKAPGRILISFGSEDKPIRSEDKPIRSEHKPIRSEDKPIRPEDKPIRPEHKPIRPEHKSLRHPRKISLVKGVH